ncbi:PREDICTED: uncharacterized protein LOC105963636 [Erythranthe guttata]|uniref:uncharacterized protein LOC105963636 n=1 Tax=Erythranthe guttata TaxID=4155 RepID=UPI00064D7C05|nr:PREDICTED: uncharacterized protein LOC105963636 [Erythranthe guttata]|eukprot:XP_012843505.1 PREDICTED: uncharacterized protein LOC105963636 [Erythranthe guttata]
MNWFNSLPTGSIDTFARLSTRFTNQFAINKQYAKTSAHIFSVVQRDNEALRNYIKRCVEAVHEVPSVGQDMLSGIMQPHLKPGRFKESIARRPPDNLEELLNRAEKYVQIEEASTHAHPKRKREDDRQDIRRYDHIIVFNSSDLKGPDEDHIDALVITASVANFLVKKILVDGGSSANIMYLHAFKQLGIDNAQFSPISTPLKGFTGDGVLSMREVELPISLGDNPCQITKIIKFLIVDKPPPYNIILERPAIHTFKSVPSSYHQKWKFPTP